MCYGAPSLTRTPGRRYRFHVFSRFRYSLTLSRVPPRVRAGADRARRTVGVGPSFPILGYDELTAGQVSERVKGLTPAELRKVREYERRHANRKSVLAAIEKSLA